ncbi:MAG: helix-turn-helix transcriptional regulator [Pseudomonadota bacterium]
MISEIKKAIIPEREYGSGGSSFMQKILSPDDVGIAVRKKRKEDGLTMADAAALCGVGYRFLSDLENGKPTVELGKMLQVLAGLGLEMRLGPKDWPHA